MKVIYIRTNPELYDLIEAQAKVNRRSVNVESQVLLEEALLARTKKVLPPYRQYGR
jgi:hypothetical protein